MNGPRPPAGLLVCFHCRSNTGYAIRPLEEVFLDVARNVVGSDQRIHFAYRSLENGLPQALPAEIHPRVQSFDPGAATPKDAERLARYVAANQIEMALGFDQPVHRPWYPTLRRAGLRAFVSYWGAPMSSLNSNLRLMFKRLEVWLTPHQPDHFVFESMAMRDSAVLGRGIPLDRTSVCYLGVDAERFRPAAVDDSYVYYAFGIPRDRKVVYYSGHFEERKGVRVILQAARLLVEEQGRRDIHFLLLGNKGTDAQQFASLIEGKTSEFVTFGGYREDVERIARTCYLATIASTGWDSFTMSSLEMAASGLPLVVSRLQGLAETVEDTVTGFLFPPGDFPALAHHITWLVDRPETRNLMGAAARERVLGSFARSHQVDRLSSVLQRVWRDLATN